MFFWTLPEVYFSRDGADIEKNTHMYVVLLNKIKGCIFKNINLTLQKVYRRSTEPIKSSLGQNNATESPGGKFVILFGKCVINNMRHYGKESSNKKPLRPLFV